jgi:predicted histone-like DNA-binding protein
MGITELLEKLIYKLVRKSVPNPSDGTRTNKWYAQIVYMGRATMAMMEDDIVDSTTATRADARAVLTAFGEVMWKRLRAGQIVELPPLGNFRLTILNNGGATTKSQWTTALIKKPHLDFQPTGGMRDVTEHLGYSRWSGDTDEVAAKLHDLELKVEDAANNLAAAELMLTRYRKIAAAAPNDKSKAAAVTGAEGLIEPDKIILEEAKKALAEARAKAYEGVADLAALGIFLEDSDVLYTPADADAPADAADAHADPDAPADDDDTTPTKPQ